MGDESWAGPDGDEDRYQLHGIVGAGTEGQVYRATQYLRDGPEDLAVKVIRPDRFGTGHESPGDLVDRWKAHAVRLRKVQHQSLVGVHDPFEGPAPHPRGEATSDDRRVFTVMTWVDGCDLREWFADHPKLKDRLRVLNDPADALDQLHRNELVHGDLKPSNMRVRLKTLPTGEEVLEQVVLVDFGLMRRITAEPPSRPGGSPGYMAPELMGDEPAPYGPLTDLYAFAGVVLFALTGEHPPEPRALPDGDVPPEARRRLTAAGVDDRTAEVIVEALRHDPGRRPQEGCSRWLAGVVDTVTSSLVGPSVPGPAIAPEPQRTRSTDLGARAALADRGREASTTDWPRSHQAGAQADQPARPSPPWWRRGRVAAAGVAVGSIAVVMAAFSILIDDGDSDAGPASDRASLTFDELDDLIGEDATDARDELAEREIEVDLAEIIDTSISDGRVLDAEQRPDGTVVLTVARHPVTRFLDEITPLEAGAYELGKFRLSGEPYERALQMPLDACSGGSNTVAYDLSRDYRRLEARVGLDDGSVDEARVRFEVILDDDVAQTAELGLGDTEVIDLDVTSALRLQLRATLLGTGDDCTALTAAVLADPHLVGVPWELD